MKRFNPYAHGVLLDSSEMADETLNNVRVLANHKEAFRQIGKIEINKLNKEEREELLGNLGRIKINLESARLHSEQIKIVLNENLKALGA